jgi:gliding-associated putative ABC transporter substrate-binding component GldG
MEHEAQQQGVTPVQVQVVKEDRFEAKRAYMGLVFFFEDRKEVIPVVQNLQTLEYDISSVIKRLTTIDRKSIGFLTGHGEPALSELQTVQSVLGRQYDLKTVNLSEEGSVPPDIAALVVMAPTSPVPPLDRFRIDQYLMRGGKVAFLLNRVRADLQQRFGRELDPGLDTLLSAYGLRVNADLVRDTRCANISIVQQSMGFTLQSQVPFPLIPLASRFNPGNMMVKDLEGLVLFFVSSVDTVGLADRNLTGDVLVTSSGQSGRMREVFMINPLSEYAPEEFPEQHIPLAVTVSGQFTSAFANREIPVDTSAAAIISPTEKLTRSIDTRIVLVGDGDFPRDQYLGNNDNVTFFANMIDYLVDDAGLITIRSKDVSLPPLDQVSDGTKSLIKYSNLIVPPLLLIAYGLLRWRARRSRRKALENK